MRRIFGGKGTASALGSFSMIYNGMIEGISAALFSDEDLGG